MGSLSKAVEAGSKHLNTEDESIVLVGMERLNMFHKYTSFSNTTVLTLVDIHQNASIDL